MKVEIIIIIIFIMIMIIIIIIATTITIIIMTTIGSMNHLKSDWVTAAAAGSQLPFVSNSAPLLLLFCYCILHCCNLYSALSTFTVNFYSALQIFTPHCNFCCSPL